MIHHVACTIDTKVYLLVLPKQTLDLYMLCRSEPLAAKSVDSSILNTVSFLSSSITCLLATPSLLFR